MKSIKFIALIMAGLAWTAASPAQGGLAERHREAIRHWRATVLPSATPEQYWKSLTELGSRIGEVEGVKAETMESPDIETSIAAVAVQAWKHPDLVEELRVWYGVTDNRIDKELLDGLAERMRREGASEDDISRVQTPSSTRARAIHRVKRLLPMHLVPAYAPIWEAWLLSPRSEPRREEQDSRILMQARIVGALSKLPSPRTPKLALEKCRLLGIRLAADPARFGPYDDRSTDVMGLILVGDPEPRERVRRLLECYQIGVEGGFAEIGGVESLRQLIRRNLSSRTMGADLLEDPKFVKMALERGRESDPSKIPPDGDRWRETKPVIEELLRHPEGLTQAQIDLLKDSLRVMPKQ
jgi:hypothetical protein